MTAAGAGGERAGDASRTDRSAGSQRALALLREGDPLVLRLAESISLAVLAEPTLVRRARHELVPEADPGVEADLWFHPAVGRPNAEGIVLQREVGEALRRGLARCDAERYERTWRLTRECHRDLSPALRLEEEVRYLAAKPSHDDRQRIRRLLASALAALVAGERRGLAAWAAGALPRFPREVRALEEAAMLGAAADLRRTRTIVPQDEGPAPIEDDWLPWIAPAARAEIGLRLLRRMLVVESPPPEGREYHRLPVLATEPMVLEVFPAEGDPTAGPVRIELRTGESEAVLLPDGPVRLRTLLGEEYRLEPREAAEAREVLDFSGVFARHRPIYDADFEARLATELIRPSEGSPGQGYALVRGGVGAGKTALLAHIAREFAAAPDHWIGPHHFFREDVPEWADVRRAEQSLVAQIERLLPATGQVREGGASLASTLYRWSEEKWEGEVLVLILDAVDQAASPELLRDFVPSTLPEGVVVVASARSFDGDLAWLEEQSGREPMSPLPAVQALTKKLPPVAELRKRLGKEIFRIPEGPDGWWPAVLLADSKALPSGFWERSGELLPDRFPWALEDAVRVLWDLVTDDVRGAWTAVCLAREAVDDALLRSVLGEDPSLPELRPGARVIELLLEHHPEEAADSLPSLEGFWIPRSDAIRSAVEDILEVAEFPPNTRPHQEILDGLAAWPVSAEARDRLPERAFEARRRFALRHALYHAAQAHDFQAIERLSCDLEYLEERLRLETPERLLEDLELVERAWEAQVEDIGEAPFGDATPDLGELLREVLRSEGDRLAADPGALPSLVHNRLVEGGPGGWGRKAWGALETTGTAPESPFRFRDGRPPVLRLQGVHRVEKENGRSAEPLRGHRGPVRGALWLGEIQTVLLTWGEDGAVLLWPGGSAAPVVVAHRRGIPVVGCAVRRQSAVPGELLVGYDDGVTEVGALDESREAYGRLRRRGARMVHGASLAGVCALSSPRERRGWPFATFGADGLVRLWNGETLSLTAVLRGHRGPVTAALDLTGDRLLTGGADGTVREWNVETGEELHRADAHGAPVTVLAQGLGYVATAGEDATIRVLDRDRLKTVAELRGHDLAVTALAFDPGGRLVSTSLDRTARRWDPETGEELERFDHPAAVTGLALPPGSELQTDLPDRWPLVTSCADGTLRACIPWSRPWRERPVADAHGLPCRGCAVDPVARSLAVWSDDGAATVWDLHSGELRARLAEPEPRRRPLIKSRGARWIAFGPRGAFEAGAGDEEVRDLGGPRKGLAPMHVTAEGTGPDDLTAVYWTESGTIERYEPKAGTDGTPKRLELSHSRRAKPRGALRDVCIVQGLPQKVAAAASERELQLEAHTRTGRFPTQTFTSDHRRVISGCAAVAGERVLTWSWDGTLQTFQVRSFFPAADPTPSLSASRFEAVLRGHQGPILACAVDLTGRLALSASADASIRLWNLEAGSLVHVWEEVSARVTALLLDQEPGAGGSSPLLAAGTADGEVILLGTESDPPVRRTPGHDGPVRGLARDPVSNTPSFYSTGDDGVLSRWEVDSERADLHRAATAYADAPLRSVSATDRFVAAQDASGSLWIYQQGDPGAGPPDVTDYDNPEPDEG